MALGEFLGLIKRTTHGQRRVLFGGRALSMAVLVLGAATVSAQTLLNVTERAQPGELISLNGSGFDGSAKLYGHYISDAGVAAADVQFQILGSTSKSILAQVPSNMGGRLWQVYVKTSGGTSNSLYVNRARAMMLDTTDAAPNMSIRIFGRNMNAPGTVSASPSVRLVNGSTSLNCTVTQSSAYYLTFRVPSTVRAGTTYQVFVKNGPGGSAGEVQVPQDVVGLSNARDTFNLGIPWAGQFRWASNVYNAKTDSRLLLKAVGDGVADDSQAIRAALSTIKAAGGGVLYLPTGSYRLDDGGHGIEVPSNVIVKGDGPGKTIWQFGYRYSASSPATGNEGCPVGFDVGDLAGIMNLTIQNMNTGAVANPTISRHWYTHPHAHRFFFSNVDMQLGNGRAPYMEGTLKGVMQDCNVTKTNTDDSVWSGPLMLINADQWTLRRNTFNYRVTRMYIEWCSHVVFEGNTVNRDNNYSGLVESGGIESSYSTQLVIMGNTVQGVGPMNTSTADGEMIMNQKSTIQDVSDVGNVTSATSTTLTNSARNWPAVLTAPNYPTGRSVVAIIAGKGQGQWRAVSSNSRNTLTVASPWTITPDSTSVYALSTFSCYQQYVLNNTVNNSSYGIQFYDGAVDGVIDSNRVNNAASIFLRCQDSSWTPNSSTRRHNIGWAVTITNNTVTNTDGNHMAQVCVGAVIEGAVSYGNLVMNVDCRGNNVQSQNPVNYPYVLGSTEGLWNTVVFEDDPIGHSDPGANVGTIWQGNSSNLNNFFNDVGTSLTGNALGVGSGA